MVSINGTNAVGATLGVNAAGRWTFALTQTDVVSPTVDAAASTAAVSTGTWVHLVGVYDGQSAMRLYVDNVLAGTGTHTVRWNAAGALQAGRLRTTAAGYGGAFSGAVDDVRLYARALNASDVANLFANTAVEPGPGVVPNPITAGLPGALQGTQQGQSASTATGYRGVTNLSSNTTVSNPGPFTVEAWIRTWTGGAVVGFGTAATGYSGTRDRLLYVDSGGRLTFGVYPGSYVTLRSPAGTTYADGAWHHVVASVGAAGLRLYADGNLVAANAAQTAAESSTGYWRVGGISLAGWPNRPANDYFTGVIDEPAVFAAQLSDQQVAWHFHANH
ncbi:LamG domain-containing protein [Dactylosporangium sp. NPDC050588]|uniref:LamG domain-containing protein n=1 Tax=Dactylosporangium sp. NPDC050588 TaxID=3157211 RepID=UPI0033F47222